MNITVNDVILCQAKWGNAIKEISLTYLNKGEYIYITHRAISEQYQSYTLMIMRMYCLNQLKHLIIHFVLLMKGLYLIS